MVMRKNPSPVYYLTSRLLGAFGGRNGEHSHLADGDCSHVPGTDERGDLPHLIVGREADAPLRLHERVHQRTEPARGSGWTVNADGVAGVARRCLFRRRIADRDEETVLFGVAGHSVLVGSEWQPRIPRP